MRSLQSGGLVGPDAAALVPVHKALCAPAVKCLAGTPRSDVRCDAYKRSKNHREWEGGAVAPVPVQVSQRHHGERALAGGAADGAAPHQPHRVPPVEARPAPGDCLLTCWLHLLSRVSVERCALLCALLALERAFDAALQLTRTQSRSLAACMLHAACSSAGVASNQLLGTAGLTTQTNTCIVRLTIDIV